MQNPVSRRMGYHGRFALQQADQAIKKDPVRALVELLTNSDDSYNRLEDAGIETDGAIIVRVQHRRREHSVLRITDFAEGMTADEMDEKVGCYAAPTSGFDAGRPVRGLWGQGLKDTIYGLGRGEVRSLRDGASNRCTLSMKSGEPWYDRDATVRATQQAREAYGIQRDGTVVEVQVSREGVRVPQFDSLRRALQRHYELRVMMSNPRRRILLQELDPRNKVRIEARLEYKAPKGQQILDEVIQVPGYPAKARLEVFRSDEPLSSPGEEGECADGGFVVVSKHVVLGLTLLRYEHDMSASRLYGCIECNYLHDLLKKKPPEPVLTATRDGVNWKHQFTRALKEVIEKRLEPLVEEERRRALSERAGAADKRLRERLDRALKEMNAIARLELDAAGLVDVDEPTVKPPFVPPGGFGFVPQYATILTGRPAALLLRGAIPDAVADGSVATITCDSSEIVVLTPQVVIRKRQDHAGIGEAQVELEGRQVGALAVVAAHLNGQAAEALVKVVSKKTSPRKSPREHKTGLFHDFSFNKDAEPKQRVQFDPTTKDVVIATRAPSVAVYLDESGKGNDTPQGQVLLAELITEAVCREIASRGVRSGKFPAVSGGETDAVQFHYVRLQNKYAHVVHSCFVDAKYRRSPDAARKRGRPTREQLLAGATSEA